MYGIYRPIFLFDVYPRKIYTKGKYTVHESYGPMGRSGGNGVSDPEREIVSCRFHNGLKEVKKNKSTRSYPSGTIVSHVHID